MWHEQHAHKFFNHDLMLPSSTEIPKYMHKMQPKCLQIHQQSKRKTEIYQAVKSALQCHAREFYESKKSCLLPAHSIWKTRLLVGEMGNIYRMKKIKRNSFMP